MKQELMNLFLFIAICFAAYILFRHFEYKNQYGLIEGMTDGSGNTMPSSTNGVAGNTLDANFVITLYDNSNNSSSLSSKLYNNGFTKNLNFSSDPSFYHYTNDTINSSVGCIYFRAGDFYLKNTNLDLSNINQILLSFGPSYGSTHCTVGLDEFFVLKNL